MPTDYDAILVASYRPSAEQLRDGLITRMLSNILINARSGAGLPVIRMEAMGTDYDLALEEINEIRKSRKWPLLEPALDFKMATLDHLLRTFEESTRESEALKKTGVFLQ